VGSRELRTPEVHRDHQFEKIHASTDRRLRVKSLWEKRWCECLGLSNIEVLKWTRAVDLDGCMAPDLELRVRSTYEEKRVGVLGTFECRSLKKIITVDQKGHVALDL
jgi:hypothetical protein